jgi:O-glycosyl hydrolase
LKCRTSKAQGKPPRKTGLIRAVQIQSKPAWNLKISISCENLRPFVQTYPYYIGHFARFIRPGARRVACAKTLEELEATAFLNPDETVAVVVLNRSERPIDFLLKTKESQVKTAILHRAIKTFLFEEAQ